jgi:glycosyltransferase involved in cell wall biosynthesis
MRIGFLSPHNPFDRSAFSGTAYYANRSLARLAETGQVLEHRVLGTHQVPNLANRFGGKIRRLWGHGRDGATFVRPQDRGVGLDWIISLVASDLLYDLGPSLEARIVHVTDATPGFLKEFYKAKLPPGADQVERAVLERSSLVVYSSKYMLEVARSEMQLQASKATFIPFGVNLDNLPSHTMPAHPTEPIELLFIGREWERKGGQIALDTLLWLRGQGRQARLTIVGSAPSDLDLSQMQDVQYFPFLDKNNGRDRQTFDELFGRAHFLLVPSRADCTPMVIAEANANSLPVIAANTGGIGSLVNSGKNGWLMDYGAGGDRYAEALLLTLSDVRQYGEMRRSSFEHYRECLNWDAWAQGLIAALKSRAHKPAA